MRENTLAPGNPGTGESGAAFTINNCNYKAGNMSSIETKETKCSYRAGIDIGSTTVKIIVSDGERIVYQNYKRHNADVRKTVTEMLAKVQEALGDISCTIAVTGSGGMNLAKVLDIEFVQEVIAVASEVKAVSEGVDVVIELGGEDAKIIFLSGGIEQRMNGICAGGTGAFIDQMAALIQTDAEGLNELAKHYRDIYPIAARCGVFAKSDIQPLINDGVPREDLAASIFQAVVNQTISGLACGRKIKGKVAFLGGPLYFLSELREAFIRTLKLTDETAVVPENAHLFAARGAARRESTGKERALSSLIDILEHTDRIVTEMHTMPPLFESEEDYRAFKERQSAYVVKKRSFSDYTGDCFLGMDAGSTTMKLAVISTEGELLYSWYGNNFGDPLKVAKEALLDMYAKKNPEAHIRYSCSSGYGEELVKNAFMLDEGEVETVSHYYAARFFEPDVDSILDIGGQDMKFIRIKDGSVDSIVLNEACSSGCGSFIENFANSLGYSAAEFAALAVKGRNPVDLGTRCTVFMNSNVKQAQKEGAPVEDIAAGLSYSVIKNALFKVIKLNDVTGLGEKVVVQGGTFYNDAVLRGFELIAGHEAVRPDIAGIMGAFGSALVARERYTGQATGMASRKEVEGFTYETASARCGGCTNNCRLTVNHFSNGKRYISGNRCEKGLGRSKASEEVPNLYEYKKKRLFDYQRVTPETAKATVGIPRVLNMYENFPFWIAFFTNLQICVELSPFSDTLIYEKGMDSIPSESECYPAKLAHGHIEWLIEKGVKTIFYPCVMYERKEVESAKNQYNCPMVISYPENIKNNVENLNEQGVRFLNPFISFADKKVLAECLTDFMRKEFSVNKSEVFWAVEAGWTEMTKAREDIALEGLRAIQWMKDKGRQGIVLAGRPYHIDPGVNHGISEMIAGYGYAVLTEDSVSSMNLDEVALRSTNQWTYHARLYSAAQFVAKRKDMELIQLNSFGCGVDAVTIDQVQELLQSAGRMYTLLKIDEVNNLGAARIRVRSLIAAMKMRKAEPAVKGAEDYHRLEFTKEMYKSGEYTILCTDMIQPHFDFFEAAMRVCGYRLINMKNEGTSVLDMGLKYVNNDACYPTMIVTGQILDAVKSGKYDTDRLAVFMVQTGGGCRASNYVAFIRKALKDMGCPQIPVISISPNMMEKNSGLILTPTMGFKALQAIIYGDVLMKVKYRMRPYEKQKGSVDALYEKWRAKCVEDLSRKQIAWSTFHANCRNIIEEFDNVPVYEDMVKPKVGIVGEVLVKYMPVANNHLADILEGEGAEVVMPDFVEFIEYCFWNNVYRHKIGGAGGFVTFVSQVFIKFMDDFRGKIRKAYAKSRHFSMDAPLKKIREYAVEILQLGNQCGEGWFLAGEVVNLIKEKVDNIVCIQPFGCLPNHIVGKGIIKKVKELYPQSNIVAVDYDPSASRVNQVNRIRLMLEVAKDKLAENGPLTDAV